MIRIALEIRQRRSLHLSSSGGKRDSLKRQFEGGITGWRRLTARPVTAQAGRKLVAPSAGIRFSVFDRIERAGFRSSFGNGSQLCHQLCGRGRHRATANFATRGTIHERQSGKLGKQLTACNRNEPTVILAYIVTLPRERPHAKFTMPREATPKHAHACDRRLSPVDFLR